MSRNSGPTPASAEVSLQGQRQARPLRVLVVDPEPTVRPIVQRGVAELGGTVRFVDSIQTAKAVILAGDVDLVLVEAELPDGSGLCLVEDASSASVSIRVIVMSQKPTVEMAVRAVRGGACDMLKKPLESRELGQRMMEAAVRQKCDRDTHRRVQRLRRLCRKLDRARHDISQQVDSLCTDLVQAYQELAEQMQQAIQSSEFSAVVRSELDLEMFIRKVLEYILDKTGATNAAMFLPSAGDEYALGGYINYDYPDGTPDFLLQQMADVLAGKIAAGAGLVEARDQNKLRELMGDAWNMIADYDLLAIPCRHKNESLAVLVLFRKRTQPFEEDLPATLANLGPMIGDSLGRIIRVHHRLLPSPFGEDQDDADDRPDASAA